MGNQCPPKHTPEWKALERAVGETEAYRVYIAYGYDVPSIFANPILDRNDIVALAKIYSKQDTIADRNSVLAKLPGIKSKEEEINSVIKNSLNKREFGDKMKTALFTYLKGMNIEIDENASDLLEGIQHSGKRNPMAGFDMIQKYLALDENITNEALAHESAAIIFSFMGKKSLLRAELLQGITNWSEYKGLYKALSGLDPVINYKKRTLENFNNFAHEQVVVSLIARMLVAGAKFDLKNIDLATTGIQKDKNRREFNKALFDSLGYRDKYEEGLLLSWWNGIYNWVVKHILKREPVKNMQQEQLYKIALDIVDDVYKEDYSKFIRIYNKQADGRVINEETGEEFEQKEYDATLAKDPHAAYIINALQTRLIASSNEKETYKLSGSQVLRRYGLVLRALSEDLHDIDGVITLENFRNEPNYKEIISWIDNRALTKLKGPTHKKAFNKEFLVLLEEQRWYMNLKSMFPSWTFDTAFIGNDHKEGESITITGYVEHPTEMEVIKANPNSKHPDNSRVGELRPKRYVLDFFLRTKPGEYPGQYEEYGQFINWKQIFEAKIRMGRAKDLNDLVFFEPKAKDIRKYKFRNKGFNYFTYLEDVISTPSTAQREIEVLERILTNKTAIVKPAEAYPSMESKEVSQKKIDALSKGLNANVIIDTTIDGYAQVDPYEAGEIPTIRINPSKGGLKGDTIIHEFGHIFIDALGGMSNPMIRIGRAHLTGSTIEQQVLNDPQYAGLDKETIDKEILATAIGQEGAKIYDARNGTLSERFINWATIFFNKLKKTLGLNYNVAADLANKMLNNDITIDSSISVGSSVIQQQRFPNAMTFQQEQSFNKISTISQSMSRTADDKYYQSTLTRGKLSRTTSRVEALFPESRFPEEKQRYYEASRQFGNMSDMMWTGIINGKTSDEIKAEIATEKLTNSKMAPYSFTDEVFKEMFDYAQNMIDTLVGEGFVVLAQQMVYSEDTRVGGALDILLIDPQGDLYILDNKSSSNPTKAGTSYGPNGEYSYTDRGQLESYSQKHTKQLSAYQKMYEDMGYTVRGLKIIPTRWSSISKNTVVKVENEPMIHLTYSHAFASKIIDNNQKKAREKFVENDALEDSLGAINARVAERVQVVMAKYKNKKKDGWYLEMAQLAAQLETNSSLGNILMFVRQGIFRTKQVDDAFEEMIAAGAAGYDPEAFTTYHTYSNTFNIISDIVKTTAELSLSLKGKRNKTKEEIFTAKYIAAVLPRLNKLETQVSNVHNKYLSLAKQRMAVELAKKSDWGEAKFRAAKTLEWKKANPRGKESMEGWEQKAKEWVNEQVANNKSIIVNMNVEHFTDLLTHAPKDISSIAMWITDPRNLNDGIIQVAERLLARAEFNHQQDFLQAVRTTEKIYEEFLEAKGGSALDYATLYEDIYERDPATGKPFVDNNGDTQNFLVGKYLSSFRTAERTWHAKNRQEGKKPTKLAKEAFYAKLRTDHLNPQWTALMARRAAVDNGGANDPILNMYEHILENFNRVDLITPDTHSLAVFFTEGQDADGNKIRNKNYRLPSIEKSVIERLKGDGVGSSLGAGWKDLWKRDTGSTESGEELLDADGNIIGKKTRIITPFKKILIDEQNREAKFIPIHFRGKVDKGQQSLDILSISMIDLNMALNYKHKDALVPQMEMIRDILQERKINQTNASGDSLINAVKGGLGFQISNKELSSNSYKAFLSLIDDRLYGIGSIDLGDINIFGKSVNTNKLVGNVMAYTSDTFLMFNKVAASVGALQGNVINWLEAIGGADISKMSLLKAEMMYLNPMNPKLALGTITDIGARRPRGLINMIAERLNARSDFDGLHARYGTNAAINLANKGTLHGLQHLQEHFTQSTLMLAILMDHKLTDKNGKVVKDTKGEEVSALDAYHVLPNGDLAVRTEYAAYLSQDEEFEISSKVRELTKRAHGNYDSNNKAMAQRYAAGKLSFMLRKWVVVGYQQRMRGIKGSTKIHNNDKLGEVDKMFFSESTGTFEEGTYTTAVKFMREIFSDMASLKSAFSDNSTWEKMTPRERSNVRKTIFEVGMIILAWSASNILGKLGKESDDDDEKALLYTEAMLARRLYSELFFYLNPLEAWKIIRAPMASFTMLEKLGDFISQGIEDTFNLEAEEYRSGDHIGESKAKVKFGKLIPIVNQLDRKAENIYKMMTK